MKHTFLAIIFSCLSLGLRAGNENTEQSFSQLMQLLATTTSRDDVKIAMGTARYINIDNDRGEERWQYRNDKTNMMLKWSTKNGELTDVEYNSGKGPDKMWQGQSLSSLEMGKSDCKDVIALLGAPANMSWHTHSQKLRYSFKDNIVELRFRNGVLTNLSVENISSR